VIQVIVRPTARGHMDARTVKRRAQRVLELVGRGDADVCVVLTDDEEIQGLNAQWRAKDKPTDVLSFPAVLDGLATAPGAPEVLGDVVISVETVARQVGDGPLPRLEPCVGPERFAAWSAHDELTFVLLHGLLHLCGHDHIKVAERKRMETLEHAYLPQVIGRVAANSETRAARTARPRS